MRRLVRISDPNKIPPTLDGQPEHLAGERAPEERVFASKVREQKRRNSRKERLPGGAATRTALEPVLAAWKGLNLGEPDDRSERALINRMAEGVTIDQLRAAVDGAEASDWLRAGRAKVPFAAVFASQSSVERFAGEGLEQVKHAKNLARQQAEERRKARERSTPSTLSRAEYAKLARWALNMVDSLGPNR